MVINMLNQMYERIDLPIGAILHSDQGWYYRHVAYKKVLCSMALFKACLAKETVWTMS